MARFTTGDVVASLRRAEVEWRNGFKGAGYEAGVDVAADLDHADLMRQLADAVERHGLTALPCESPSRLHER